MQKCKEFHYWWAKLNTYSPETPMDVGWLEVRVVVEEARDGGCGRGERKLGAQPTTRAEPSYRIRTFI